MWGRQHLQGSDRDSPPFDGQHHAQENDDEHQEAGDHTGHLHRAVHLLLWLHGVRILSGGTLERKGHGDVEKAHTLDGNYNDNSSHLRSAMCQTLC